MKTLTEIDKLTIRTALEKMTRDGSLSICTIDNCLMIAGCTPLAHEYNLLRTLHCVHFKDMPPPLREQIGPMIAKLFDTALDTAWLTQLLEGGTPPTLTRQ